MSRISLKFRSTKTKALIGTAAVAAIVAAAVSVPSSGADFSASDTGTVSVNTATLSLGLGNTSAANQGTFALNYANLQPGQMVTKTFYVKNTGSINADATLGNPISVQQMPSGLTAADFGELMVGVNGATPVPATSLPASFNLGQVNAGHVEAVKVTLGLSDTATNEWQNKDLKVGATVALKQVN